ncbi:DUF3427 domain-containing protein [Sporichthya polymorpha]|uniref:DUF3427 domain-containing protein n=1 Tax=Sporichthya polymorpha TaxID=35751 RepID=UPI00037F9E43|nr:DUF3427 domain-containing protein [Sporichthya polymorpha]
MTSVDDLPVGLYEALVTERLAARLRDLADDLVQQTGPLLAAEAPDRLAWHVAREVERAIAHVPDTERVGTGVATVRALLQELAATAGAEAADLPVETGDVLRAIRARNLDGTAREVASPLVPLLDTTLLTNAPGEPNLWAQLISEVDSAAAIDVVMAFIRRSGIAPLLEPLRRHCESGKPLRVLTTTYTGSTEAEALDLLADLGADVRVSYDLTTTRLHAKAWMFHRPGGYSTGYIGSSNLTRSAQVTGLEWNVRLSGARNPDVVAKFAAMFDGYWNSGDFLPYDPAQFDDQMAHARRDAGPHVFLSPVEITPTPFQDRLLELLELARSRGQHRNLLVAATGTGKTVMAALDYARLRAVLPRARLLFVAHRQEILDQSMATFRHALRDASFGEKWVGGSRPVAFEHVFASIQSLNAADLERLPTEHFDVVIVDEIHHGAAPSYARLLDRIQPAELLGLTATPERSDGLPILHWFGDRITAELRLWDAIDQQYLAPFTYFGIHDGVDLRDVPWRRGRGYDTHALSSIYTSADSWARLVIKQVMAHADVTAMRCLGFCVDIEHAHFMARHFRAHDIDAVAIDASTPPAERQAALRDLADGRVRAVFSVDLFNEGVDVPVVDTVLMLRPTESPTLFLQQLGRGLRKAPNKAACTVLDFVGTHRREFRFDRRFRALLGGSRKDVERAVQQGFPYLPAGCHMHLDRVATDVVLASLRNALPSRWPAKVEELRSLRVERPDLGLAGFLDESGLDLDDVYQGGRGWSDLQAAAGVVLEHDGPHETALRRAIGRLLHVDDAERLDAYRELFADAEPPDVSQLPARRRRLLAMVVAVVGESVLAKDASLQAGVDLLWQHPQVRAEARELLSVLDQRVDHVSFPIPSHPDVPLEIHARYSRIEIFAATGVSESAKMPPWQTGVYDAKDIAADLLAITMDKSGESFSPTTRYRDYAISRTLLHWESQSVTRADSPTGRRYQQHAEMGRSIFVFARLKETDRAFWFLGPATYRSHEGERPMAITWELEYPLPGDLYASFASAVA